MAPRPPAAEPTPGFARNSLASLLRTASGAFLALLLPPLLIRRLGTDQYGVWALGVEVGTYLALLDLGALSAVGHFTASLDAGDREGRGRAVSTLLALQVGLLGLGGVVLAVLVALVPLIWSDMPGRLVADARWTLGLIGASALVSLLSTAVSGYFLAIHRIVVPAALTMLSRLAGAVAVGVLAVQGHGITVLAVAWAATTTLGHLAIAVAFARLGVPVRRSLVSGPLAGRMVRFCAAYGIWTLATVLVIGLDTTIVARLDFSAVAPYAAAAGVVGVLTAVYGSALAPLVPLAARLDAEGRTAELDELFVRLVRWGATAVVAVAAVAVLTARPVLAVWLGGGTAGSAVPLLQVLVAATAVRLLTLPFPVVLFGTGEHRVARWTPLVEGTVNVAVSVVAGLAWGPIGVAVGTLVGALVGVAVHLGVNLPRTRSLSVRGRELVARSLAGPLAVALPALGGRALVVVAPAGTHLLVAAATILGTFAVAWTVALAPEDRQAARRALATRRAAPSPPPSTTIRPTIDPSAR